MKCAICGMPVILDKKLNKKFAKILDDFIIYEDSAEIFILNEEDNDFLKLCVKELAALKKRNPHNNVTVTAVVKRDGESLGDFWYEEDENGEKSMIADAVVSPENMNRAKNSMEIWTWIISQCEFIFEYGYDEISWRYKEVIRKIAAENRIEILPLSFSDTEPAAAMFSQMIHSFMILRDRNILRYDNKEDADKGFCDDVDKIVKLFKYYELLSEHLFT